MTNRTRTLTVVLDHDYREDDVENIMNAIRMIQGVIAVDINVTDTQEYMAIETAKMDLRNKIYGVLE